MWRAIKKYFSDYPAQEKVAKLLLQQGLSVRNGKVFCENIEVPALRIARALEIDRRAVNATAKTISSKKELKEVYENLHPVAFFKDVARALGYGVVEIIPTDPAKTGILAGVSKVISDSRISIRQAITEDPEFSEDARLFVICEREIPAALIKKIKKVRGVKSVVIY